MGNLGTFNLKTYDETVQQYTKVDRAKVTDAAENQKRHAGVFADAMKKSKKQLQKSIISRTAEVERHAEKMQFPEKYISDWSQRDERERAGLLKKWEKDMIRNAEQAEIEMEVFERRF